MLLNREKLSELLGCSLRTIDEYRRQGMPGEPPQKPGGQWRFDSGPVIQWLRDSERTNAIGEVAKIDEGEARRRKLAAEAAIAEHELAEMQGAVVSIEDWRVATSKAFGAVRAKLLGIGKAIGPEVAIESEVAVCEAAIQGAINEALQELSESEIELDEPGGTDGHEPGDEASLSPAIPPARPNRKRVGGQRKKVKPGVKRKTRKI